MALPQGISALRCMRCRLAVLFALPRAASMVMPHQMAPAPPQFALFHAVTLPPLLLHTRPTLMVVVLRSPAALGDLSTDQISVRSSTIWISDLKYWMGTTRSDLKFFLDGD
jgi:hypothetical protein